MIRDDARAQHPRNDRKTPSGARTILFGLSGHGHFDLAAYDSYLSGSLQDHEHPQSAIEAALAGLPWVAE